jgi:uroporphyrinogen-III synthase
MNKRVLITRPRGQADDFARAFREAGFEPIIFPVIEIGPALDTVALDRALQKLDCYEWMVLTSVNGVEAVWNRLSALGLAGIPPKVQVAAIGPKTAAALQAHGVGANFMPSEYVAEAILPGLGDIRGRWILLPRADLARPALAKAIQEADGVAHEIAVYRTLPAHPDPHSLQALRSGLGIVTFTSSSTVRNFIALVSSAGLDPRNLPGKPVFACIGPVTAETAREEGLPVDIVADEYTTDGLLRAISDFCK